MSVFDEAIASFERIVAQHGGDAFAVVVRDDRQVDDLATGDQDVDPTTWTRPCSMPVPFALRLQNQVGIRTGDIQILVAHHAAITIPPKPGLLAVVTGPGMGSLGMQYDIAGADRHPGGYEIQLRGAREVTA